MLKNTKIKYVFTTLAIGVACLAIYQINTYKPSLPRQVTEEIEPGTLYQIKMTFDNPPIFGVWGVQQDYLVPLNAGQLYRFEAKVNWTSAGATLTNNQRVLGELNCGYNARCNFTVKPEQDILALLRIYTDDPDNEFTLDIRKEDNSFFGSEQSERTEILKPAPIPIIDTNTTYTGNFFKSDAPLFRNGLGYVQDYRIHLSEGQNVKIGFKQDGIKAGIQILDRELKTLDTDFMLRDEQDPNLCIETKATYDGMYLIRILSKDPNAFENGKYKLDINIPLSGEKTCQR